MRRQGRRVASRCRSRRHSSSPDMPGSIQSSTTRSKASSATSTSASSPSAGDGHAQALGGEVVADQLRQRRPRPRRPEYAADAQYLIRHLAPVNASRRQSLRMSVRGGVVALRPVVGQRHAVHEVVHVLGDVGGVVADALDVLGGEQQMRAQADVARVLHHVGEELAEQRIVHGVDALVAAPHGDRPSRRRARHRRRARP